MGVSDNDVKKLQLEALRLRQEHVDVVSEDATEDVKFDVRALPSGSTSYRALATFSLLDPDYHFDQNVIDQVEYLYQRRVDMKRYDFYYSDLRDLKMHRRVIVPFTWHGDIVGYTARAIDDDIKPRYHSSHDAGYVYNLDRQTPARKFVIVCEGVFDAISIDGVSVLGNTINETQVDVIDGLARDIIVVPDFDGSGGVLVDHALEYGWQVSFPVWSETCKDINEAVCTYGKLFVLKSILAARESNPLRIQLLKRRYFSEKKSR
jgi:hypothetical protein